VPRAYTIGYEGRTLDGLVERLQRAGVERVLDVRARPLSRKRGFSKKARAEKLGRAGIVYIHVRAAGNPFRDPSVDIERRLLLYSEHLEAHAEVFDAMMTAIDGYETAILCVEAEAHACHRSVLTRLIAARSAMQFVDL
jgi:uncharacterized protein (DUF488 family)